MGSSEIPRPPRGLGEAGRAYWRAVHTEYATVTGEHLEVVLLRCHVRDRIAAMEATVAAEGLMVGTKAHPLLAQIRADQRLDSQLGARLVAADGKDTVPSGRSARGINAARARWGRAKAVSGGA